MAIDLKSLGKGASDFLKQMLPFLVQEQYKYKYIDYQTKAWLEKSMKEYEAYGKIQSDLQKQSAMNAIFGDVSDVMKGGVKGRPFPGMEFIKRGQQFGLPMGELNIPPEEEQQELLAGYQQAAMPLVMARMSGKKPSEEDVATALNMFGFDTVETLIGDFAGDMLKRVEQGLRAREVSVQEQLIPTRKFEAETSRAKVDIEKKGGQTAKEIQAEIRKLSNDRDTQVAKYTGIGSPTGIIFDNQARVIAAKIGKIDRRLKEIEQMTGRQILPREEDYATFEKMARENVAAGRDIDWEQAMIIGFDIYWILTLQKELRIIKKE
ncbi:hypothetical protein LCGC14_0461030 [marine sediment metagenome]|uniref:Uncharacterized protein n=1 Tax=marine sediment metagenome TaxID=412755 RepID=A0A0F9V1X6_9ZZZZ|nr:hypothetical protein [bacterium]